MPDGSPLPVPSLRLYDPPSAPPGSEGPAADPDSRVRHLGLQLADLDLAREALLSVIRDAEENERGATRSEKIRAAAELAKVSGRRAEVAGQLEELTRQESLRREFLEDRAHAVVLDTLLALDEQFREVGFGSWMPFRYPDQWLMFCGVMRRVLAANGLIHTDDPSVWRRLLEETPPVPTAGGSPGAEPHGGLRCLPLPPVAADRREACPGAEPRGPRPTEATAPEHTLSEATDGSGVREPTLSAESDDGSRPCRPAEWSVEQERPPRGYSMLKRQQGPPTLEDLFRRTSPQADPRPPNPES